MSQTKTACENVRPRKFDLLTTDNVCFVVGLSVVLSFDLLGTQRRDAVGEALVSVFVVLFFNQSNESRLLLDIPPLSCFLSNWYLDLRFYRFVIVQKRLSRAKYESSGSKRLQLPRDRRQVPWSPQKFENKREPIVVRERLLVAIKWLRISPKGE